MAFKVQFGYNRIQHDLGARNVGKFIEHPGEILLGKSLLNGTILVPVMDPSTNEGARTWAIFWVLSES